MKLKYRKFEFIGFVLDLSCSVPVSFEFNIIHKSQNFHNSTFVHCFRSHLININGKEREERIDASQDKDICLLNVEVKSLMLL